MIDCKQLAERMKAGILGDVQKGVVPKIVGSFEDLNCYVDAYRYGGTAELLAELEAGLPDTEAGQAVAWKMLCDVADPAADIVDQWIKSGGLLDGLPKAKPTLIRIDSLIKVEGDAPALGHRHSLNELLTGVLSDSDKEQIAKDIATIEYWRCVFAAYVGREEKLLENEGTLINVWEPAINDHRLADGFHRLAAAKLAGLRAIGARLAPTFRLP